MCRGSSPPKSEQARRPWGPRACSMWLTVLTPANHWAEGFTDRPVTNTIHATPGAVHRRGWIYSAGRSTVKLSHPGERGQGGEAASPCAPATEAFRPAFERSPEVSKGCESAGGDFRKIKLN